MTDKKQTHINVLPKTQKQIEILKSVHGTFGYELVETWADEAWDEAKKKGLVTDAMISLATAKKNASRAESVAA